MAEVTLYGGEKAVVDNDDLALVSQYSWSLDDEGYAIAYAVRNSKRTTVRMHRLICGEPKGKEIDHRDRDHLNCRRSNLRIATKRQNQGNRIAKRTGKTSSYKGVCWKAKRNRWHAQIRKRPKTVHLGYFIDEEDAARAYDKAAREHFGEFALTNF